MPTNDVLHYGTPRRSGRYPWGSGGELLSAIDTLVAEGLLETEIAAALGMKTTELRDQKNLAKLQEKEAQRLHVTRQREAGMSIVAIARENDIPESTVRDLLKPGANAKFRLIKTIADVLAAAVAKFKYVDVGEGVEQYLGVTGIKMKNAIALLKNEGYTIHYLREEQLGTGKATSYKILAAPGTEFSEVYANRDKVTIPLATSSDRGHSFDEPLPVTNFSSNRIKVVYNPDKDGLIELRPGVPELNMGGKRYAQVRIAVDGTHYIKGVAVYNDKNLPKGADLVFYTSKKVEDNPLNNLKEQKLEDVNPFGSTVKPNQRFYIDTDGNKVASAVNIVYEEGDWSVWSNRLSSQFLSKQDPELAAQQLKLVSDRRKDEFEEIMSLTNDVVKAHLLQQFSDAVDSDAVRLKAAAFSRQTNSVLIPISSMKPTEVYAPNYENGTSVVLVRHPHGGIFEIPRLVVNNKNPEAKRILGSAPDAIGIHADVAKRLSGADFDGDTVLVIPDKNRIRTSPALDGLKDFDPRLAYPEVPGLKPMSESGKQREMGIVSNLITDMTIRGASPDEIARAVRHSMVVIDAAKHRLNYRQSYLDNGIAALKESYQSTDGKASGASTLISRAKSKVYVEQRKDNYLVDPSTGQKIFTHTGKSFVDKDGNRVPNLSKSTRMYETEDANTLSSGTRIERVYAKHANELKAMGNQARKNMLNTSPQQYSPSARKTYEKEVLSLDSKLRIAMKNQPLERKAQLVAGELYRTKLANNPGMSNADKRTARGRSLVAARIRVGAQKELVDITPQEWQAIQMGAVSPTKLQRILRNADADQIKQYATPRTTPGLSSGKVTRAIAMLELGYTNAEVAGALGVPVNQINSINKDQ